MLTKKPKTKKLSIQTDFAQQILHAPNRKHTKKEYSFKYHIAGIGTLAAFWLGYVVFPTDFFNKEVIPYTFEFNEEVDAFVNLAKQDHYIIGPMPLAPVDSTQAKIAKARLTSPILADNMATTQFFGPPEAFEALPHGRVTEIKVKSGDTLGSIFNRVGIESSTLHAILKQDIAGAELQEIHPGQTLTFVTDDQGLKQIRYPHSEHETFVINKVANDISVDLIERPREVRRNYASATITDSLYVSAKNARIDNSIIMQLAEIFAYDIDFYLDIKRGDKFRVLYEEYYVDGEKVDNGPILAAEFTNQGKNYQVIRYANRDGSYQYYTSDGMTLRKAFLRSPVEYSRISSHFNLARKHPILHTIRAHKGVDYAAPRGTPIVASGDGKIVQLGRRGAYGNVVEIQHNGQYRTLYAHMNGFAKNLKVGHKVEQGQVIGYVGSTGLASGPHLHYEFKVNGIQKDPVKVDLPMTEPLPRQEKDKFLLHASNMFNELDKYAQILLAHQASEQDKNQG